MKPHWDLGMTIYHKTNPEMAGILTGRIERPDDVVTYLVAWPEEGEVEHWECELTEDKTYDTTS